MQTFIVDNKLIVKNMRYDVALATITTLNDFYAFNLSFVVSFLFELRNKINFGKPIFKVLGAYSKQRMCISESVRKPSDKLNH